MALIVFIALSQRPLPHTNATLALALLITSQATIALLQFIIQDDLGLRLLGEIELDR